MEYTINQLAKIAGVSARTLRYYDEINLLKPLRVSSTGYRIYGAKQVERLQQILYFKVLDVPLDRIQTLLSHSGQDQDTLRLLQAHRQALENRREQLNLLIQTLDKTILEQKGLINMTDQEKFEGFKQGLIDENDRKYGQEVRAKYGDQAYDASKAAFKNMSEEAYQAMNALGETILKDLEGLVIEKAGGKSDLDLVPAMKDVAIKHKKWIAMAWGHYNPQAHRGLVDMYLADSRFTAYYDRSGVGATQILRDAVVAMLDED